jgi:hypothetical protein
MSMEELSAVLWQERGLLERLLFKLEVERLVLASGRTRWLAMSVSEIEDVLDRIREAELLRALAVDVVAAELGLTPDPSLQHLADASAETWQALCLDHRAAFKKIAAEVRRVARENREMLLVQVDTGHLRRPLCTESSGGSWADAGGSQETGSPLDDILGGGDGAKEQMRTAVADVGARQARVETAPTSTVTSAIDRPRGCPERENVDLAEAIVDQQLREVAYQAALGATVHVLQPSLVDFLR